MTNGNGGLFAALTGQYGNRSDIGALSVLSLNDGPFLTMIALGLLGERFPVVVFLAVLLPLGLGLLLGNLDEDLRNFLRPGEKLLVPFFAFALGAGMNLAVFAQWNLLLGGVALGLLTLLITGGSMWLALGLFGFRSRITAFAEASAAGNATATPAAIAAAAAAAGSPNAAAYREIAGIATAQISIAVILTALLCPVAVMLADRWQRARGIDGTAEEPRP
jgi:2-keto-3-deoxygluconate permease